MAILLIIGYCIIIHPVICIIMIVVLDDWCHMKMRPAQLVSNAFLYTTPTLLCGFVVIFENGRFWNGMEQ